MSGVIFFIVLPYLAAVSVIAGSIYRYRFHGFSVSSFSSQFLESRSLYFGSRPFHWGIITLFFGHLAGFLVPRAVLAWNGVPLRLYILEIAAFSFGLLALIGFILLVTRRIRSQRIRVVTTRMDVFIFLVLFVLIVTGLWTAFFFRWGLSWFAEVMTPYLRSILAFRPDTLAVIALPLMVRIHIVTAFILIGSIPFTRLMHFLVYPFDYLWREYQVVIWNYRKSTAKSGK